MMHDDFVKMCSCSYCVKLCALGLKVATQKYGDIICKAKLLFAVADLPAKATLLNCVQYNGKYGCHTCKLEGQQVYT